MKGFIGGLVVGAGLSAVVTYILTKKHEEKIRDKEINSIMREFGGSTTEPSFASEDISETEVKPNEEPQETFETIVKEQGYNDESDVMTIAARQLGDLGYSVITLKYYTNSVFVDEAGDVMDHEEELLGMPEEAIAELFDSAVDDKVYLRNFEKRLDIVIQQTGEFYEEE